MPWNVDDTDFICEALGIAATDEGRSRVETATAKVTDAGAITRLQGYLGEVGLLMTGIEAQRDIADSPLLQTFRQEGRRHSKLLSLGIGLAVAEDIWS